MNEILSISINTQFSFTSPAQRFLIQVLRSAVFHVLVQLSVLVKFLFFFFIEFSFMFRLT